jgi:hypothetical protein
MRHDWLATSMARMPERAIILGNEDTPFEHLPLEMVEVMMPATATTTFKLPAREWTLRRLRRAIRESDCRWNQSSQ